MTGYHSNGSICIDRMSQSSLENGLAVQLFPKAKPDVTNDVIIVRYLVFMNLGSQGKHILMYVCIMW